MGYRDRLLKKGWHFKGAYAEKIIAGNQVIQTIASTLDSHFICKFQRKCDFWKEIGAKQENGDGFT
jgi:hypothetical protein